VMCANTTRLLGESVFVEEVVEETDVCGGKQFLRALRGFGGD